MPSFAARYANPHDRYGARLIWLAVTAAAVAAVRLYEERQRLRATGIVASPPQTSPAHSAAPGFGLGLNSYR